MHSWPRLRPLPRPLRFALVPVVRKKEDRVPLDRLFEEHNRCQRAGFRILVPGIRSGSCDRRSASGLICLEKSACAMSCCDGVPSVYSSARGVPFLFSQNLVPMMIVDPNLVVPSLNVECIVHDFST